MKLAGRNESEHAQQNDIKAYETENYKDNIQVVQMPKSARHLYQNEMWYGTYSRVQEN